MDIDVAMVLARICWISLVSSGDPIIHIKVMVYLPESLLGGSGRACPFCRPNRRKNTLA